eukprot:8766279-Pyramimonas_sp.AAC.1
MPGGGGATAHRRSGGLPGLAAAFRAGPARSEDWQQPFSHHAQREVAGEGNSPTTEGRNPLTDHVSDSTVRGAAGQPRGPPQRRPNSHAPDVASEDSRPRNTARGLRSILAQARRQQQRTTKRREARRRARSAHHTEGATHSRSKPKMVPATAQEPRSR